MTSYRLSIVTFALGRTVYPQYITSQTKDDDGRNTVAYVDGYITLHYIKFFNVA